MDSLLITGGGIYIFEVKNYEGDFYIEQDRWYTILIKVVSMQGSERFRGWFREGVLNCSEGSYETR
ncbi:nuclease-related domain-containing protein [Cytobacillus firmus]|uniref:nuclease-related domain-containing protein n=1 Tax=Cytobacillus TaxID=2675230 RepID=UPI0037C0C98E